MKIIKNKNFLIFLVISGAFYLLLSFVVAYTAFTIGDQKSNLTPESVGLVYKEIDIETAESYISSWWIPNDSDVTLIMLHGLRGQKADEDILTKIKAINDMGFSIVAIDFRNHGKSGPGKFTFGLEEVDDVFSTMKYYKEYEGIKNFGIWGFSYGATTALFSGMEIDNYVEDVNLVGIFAESPYMNLLEVFTDQVAYRTPFNKTVANLLKPGTVFLTKIIYDFDFNDIEEKFNSVDEIYFPTTVISCEIDEIIPITQTIKIGNKLGNNSGIENFELCEAHGEAYSSDSKRYQNLIYKLFK